MTSVETLLNRLARSLLIAFLVGSLPAQSSTVRSQLHIGFHIGVGGGGAGGVDGEWWVVGGEAIEARGDEREDRWFSVRAA